MLRSASLIARAQRLEKIQSIKNLIIRNSSAQAQAKPSQTLKDEDLKKLEKIKIPRTNSFVQNLFTGQAMVEAYLPYPQVLNEEDLGFIDMLTEPIHKMWSDRMNDLLEIEESGVIPDEVFKALKEMGSMGTQVPQEYGGLGCNNTQYARLGEISGEFDLGIGVTMGAHQSIGYKGLVLFGTPEQKEKYLPDLATGNIMAAFALTEPSAGSDAGGIKTRAVPSEDGSHWIINGSKTYISNGGFADYFTVFAQTPVKNAKGEVKDKVTAFWVPRSEGLTSGPPMKKMGIKLSNTTEIWFDNVKVPSENIIGEVGGGFKVAMKILNNGRYGMGCALSGTMRRCIKMASEYANNRTQFGNKIANFTAIQEKIARMTLAHYGTQSHAYMLSGIMDNGMKDFQLEAAISKIFGSDSAWMVADETLQIFGGMGYIRDTGVEKILRDVRIFRIFEGTNEILRLFISLTGMQFAGGHLREIQRAMKNPVGNMRMIFDEGSKRLKRSVGLDAPDIASFVHPSLQAEAQQLAKNILAFNSAVEHLLIKYSTRIVLEQMVLTRMANVVIDLYSTLVILSRASRALTKNIHSAEHESNMCKVFCSEANTRIERNLNSVRSTEHLKNDEILRRIATDVLQNNGLIYEHPLN